MASGGGMEGGLVGDVSVGDTWDTLAADPAAVLIDVRTRAEWTYVGLPRLEAVGKRLVLTEWQATAGPEDFAERLKAELKAIGASADAPLFFICRSGSRSRSAAMAMAAAGYRRCFNVADGFEGPLDGERHRGAVGGWKAAGLPWGQT